jgi:hypothetical protein
MLGQTSINETISMVSPLPPSIPFPLMYIYINRIQTLSYMYNPRLEMQAVYSSNPLSIDSPTPDLFFLFPLSLRLSLRHFNVVM